MRKAIGGSAKNKLDLELRFKTNPSSEDIYKLLKKHFGVTFNIVKSLVNDHQRLKPVPGFHNKGSSQGKFWLTLHRSTQGHLRILNAARDLALSTSNEETIY